MTDATCRPDPDPGPWGSWSFSVRTPLGRVIANVSNKVLQNCFGGLTEDEFFCLFASHIQLLHEAVLTRLKQGHCSVVEIEEADINNALSSMHDYPRPKQSNVDRH